MLWTNQLINWSLGKSLCICEQPQERDTQARVSQKGRDLTVTTRQGRRESYSSPSSSTLLWLTWQHPRKDLTWPSAPGLKLLDVPTQEPIQPNRQGTAGEQWNELFCQVRDCGELITASKKQLELV